MLQRIAQYTLLCIALFSVQSAHASHSSTTKSSKYDIAVPVLFGVTLADIEPDFGDPRGGGTRTHEGQDIMAPEGTPIVSPIKGTVLKYGTAASPGKYVYIKGSDGYLYAFMHLHEIAKLRKNQKVNIGDVIGTVGETGNAMGTTPHLHFEIRKGKPVDPYTRLKKEFTLEDKIKYLNAALKDLKNRKDLVRLMTERFGGVLLLAEAQDLKLDPALTKALKETSTISVASTSLGLRQGSEGVEVKALQGALIKAQVGRAAYRLAETGTTGYFGMITRDALIEFQKAFGVSADGVFTAATRQAFIRGGTGEVKGVATAYSGNQSTLHTLIPEDLTRGMEGVAVSVLQAFLIREASGTSTALLMKEGPTGYFGTITEAALKEYQLRHALSVSGVYDEETRNHLRALAAI